MTDNTNTLMSEMVPPQSSTINELLPTAYLNYVRINKTIQNQENDEYSFKLKKEDIFYLISKSIDSQVYSSSTIKNIIETEKEWKQVELKVLVKNIEIKYKDFTSILDKDNLHYPDYMKVFYFLQEHGIYPSRGRILSIMIEASTKEMIERPTSIFDWENVLSYVDKKDIKYLDFMSFREQTLDVSIELKDVKVLMFNNFYLKDKDFQILMKHQIKVNADCPSYEIKINT